MKRIIIILVALLCAGQMAAQNALNDKADNIVGTYASKYGDNRFKVRIVKLNDGTYRGQVLWMEHDRDAKGNKLLDTKNPDKRLRLKPADQVVLFSGLKYDAKNKCWGDTKIYDPQHGIKANMTAEFIADGRLRIRGSLFGIGQSIYWTAVAE
ncbi:MAG: DUF2147 domain-containing protein [Bacteroidales bacterium]|nr:DUF2147 domain-containing protein [Bacteroidales bacterium]